MEKTALERAIDAAGGQSALARKLGGKVRQGYIWKWLRPGKRVPAEYVLPIESATSGAVTRHELRPDLYPLDRLETEKAA